MGFKQEVNVSYLIHRLKHAQAQSLLAIILGLGVGAAGLYVSLWEGNLISISFTSEQKDSYTVAGLQNLGNNCFLNVILQALASSRCFLSFLQSSLQLDGIETEEKDEKMPLRAALSSLLEELHTVRDEKSILNPRKVMLAMCSYVSSFNLTRQQDASEAFLHLLSALEEEMSECYILHGMSLSEITIFHSKIHHTITEGQTDCERWKQQFVGPFDGTIGSSITCKSCSSMLSMDFEFFRCLPLSLVLDRRGDIMPGCTLVDCLKHFTAVEQVESYRCVRCWHSSALKYLSRKAEKDEEKIKKLEYCVNLDSCDCNGLFLEEEIKWTGLSSALKQLCIGRCPKILCIHLQRAFMTGQGDFIKLQGYISFPMFLDLFPFTEEEKFEEEELNLLVPQLRHLNLLQEIHMPPQIFKIAPEENSSDTLSQNVLKSAFNPSDNINSHLHSHETSDICGNEKASNISSSDCSKQCMYRLSSVVEHYGKPGSGHYAIYRRLESETDIMWFYVSDREVSEVSEETVLAAEATLLFYEMTNT